MTSEIERDHAMALGEVRNLSAPVPGIATPAVHEHKRWLSTSMDLERNRRAIFGGNNLGLARVHRRCAKDSEDDRKKYSLKHPMPLQQMLCHTATPIRVSLSLHWASCETTHPRVTPILEILLAQR